MTRRFFILSHDSNPRLVFVADYSLGDFDDTKLLLGDRLDNGPTDEVRLVVDGSKKWHDYINTPLSWSLLSTAFKEGISDLVGKDDQFFGITLYDKKSQVPYTGFWLANFTTKIDCLDTDRSVISKRDTGKIEDIPQMVIRGESVPEDLHIFRERTFPFNVIIDSSVFTRIYKLGVKGMGLIECESS